MPTLMIKKINGLCTIQDLGRLHAQHLGFSAGGAADEYGFLSANKLLENDSNAAALELTFANIVLLAQADCTIAITGADCQVSINDKPAALWRTLHLHVGDTLLVKTKNTGLHTYIAIAGGINSKVWLNSRAQTLNEITLGFGEPQLAANSKIKLSAKCYQPELNNTIAIPQAQQFYPTDGLTLRFIPSTLWQKLPSPVQQQFLKQTYQISPASNRMGYRLLGEALTIDDSQTTTLSKPVTFGAIQLPNDGQPIVLMKERQTIGGYPVLGSVIQTDLFRLSQLRPAKKVTFAPVTVEFAQQQLSSFYQRFSLKK